MRECQGIMGRIFGHKFKFGLGDFVYDSAFCRRCGFFPDDEVRTPGLVVVPGQTTVHVNVPTVLWQAVAGMAEHSSTTKTDVLVRALNREAHFTRRLLEDPGAKIYVEHGNGEREIVAFGPTHTPEETPCPSI